MPAEDLAHMAIKSRRIKAAGKARVQVQDIRRE
jgi:hypothetical protein